MLLSRIVPSNNESLKGEKQDIQTLLTDAPDLWSEEA